MANDLYWDVLLIPKEKRPPTYFDLLGLAPGEADTSVIEAAVQQQVKRVKLCQSGPHAAQCVRLIKELAQAKATLTDPKKRAEYLAILPNAEPVALKAAPPKPTGVKPAAASAAVKKPVPKEDLSAFAVGPPVPVRRPKKNNAAVFLAVGAAIVVVLAIGVWVLVAVVLSAQQGPNPPGIAANTNPTPPTTPVPPRPDGRSDRTQGDSDPRNQLPVLDAPPVQAEKTAEPRSFNRHIALVQGVALSPNGQRFLSVSTDKSLIDWGIQDGKPFRATCSRPRGRRSPIRRTASGPRAATRARLFV